MGLALITPAAELAIDQLDLCLHMKVEGDGGIERDLIEDDLRAAIQEFERDTGRQLVTATYELTLDAFPSGDGDEAEIELPKPPLISVTSVKYIDTDGVEQTLATTVWEMSAPDPDEPGVVRLQYDQAWPETRDQRDAVRIRFVAGYGAASALPELIGAAIKLRASMFYEERVPGELDEDKRAAAPPPLTGYKRIVRRYKVMNLA